MNLLSVNEFNLGLLDLELLVSKISTVQVWPMVDLVPLEKWIAGRISHVDDAAHVMLPVGSGGAMPTLFDALAPPDPFEKVALFPLVMSQVFTSK